MKAADGYNNDKVVEILLQKGVDLDAVDKVRELLRVAVILLVCDAMFGRVEGNDSANVCSCER